ncbi:MAG: 4-hydroxythreonine-4-phosphate dehydrogenase PdxA [Leptospiraceae bacterium]|nr:4-hydroxythreonine-4-phosphate dehydrogenase PdxA [Leptospiraceae bacterium]
MKPIIISGGDPTGIGEEIFIDSIKELQKLSKSRLVVFVSSMRNSKISQFEPIELEEKVKNLSKGLILYRSKDLLKNRKYANKPGKPSELSGKIAYDSLQLAIKLQKKIGGNMITLPLSKEWVIKAGIKNFVGHTETLSKEYGKDTFMMMVGQNLRVIPLTTHIPIAKVSKFLKKLKIDSLIQSIKNNQMFHNPVIGFCGLNPHAGENGKIGKEEIEILIPYITMMKKNGLKVEGPLAADSVFTKHCMDKYNLILSCYHDQGLIPFKALEGLNGVNVTLGLNFIRVSPDHGTAFDIAGKGMANSTSFQKCIKLLKDM